MHILSDTGTTLTLVTGSAVSTDYVVDYVDHAATSFSPLSGRGNVATATTTTILAAPAANTTRQVKSIKITNRHASDAQTVQVFVVASASSYALSENMALAAGQCVLLNDKGWTIMSDKDQVVVATGKLLTVSNTLTLAGTDGTTMTFPTTNATIARTDAAQTFTGNQTFSGKVIVDNTTNATSTTDGSLQTDGGLSVVKNAVIGGTLNSGPASITGTTATDGPTYSAELLTSSGWTSADWTGDFVTGFTHATGNTSVLSNTLAAVIGNKYQITYTITYRTAGSITINFGGESLAGVTATGSVGPTATTTGNLTITPTTDFNGKIVISVKQITAGSSAVYTIKDSAGNIKSEIRTVSGSYNTANGYQALYYNTTGFSNDASGYQSLYSNTTGSYNTASGYRALYYNTTGSYNTANGCAALFYNTTGIHNTANGLQALYSNTTGSYNAANGYLALFSNTTGSNNTANGYQALYYNTTGSNNTASGYRAGYDNTTGSTNSCLGYNTGRGITTGSNNTILGANVTGLAAATTDNIVLATGQGTVRARFNGTRWNVQLSQLSIYANNAAAVSGGLASGDLYRTGGDPDLICVVH
jgi:hypothetical protein